MVTLRTPVEARVDAVGRYTISPPGDVEVRTFTLVGTDEGWRIGGLADGIMVTRFQFEGTFGDLSVYFADRTGKYLVPEIRWLPVSDYDTLSIPSDLVSSLLQGPSDWLRPAVATGAPRNTRPTVNAVKVQDGVAVVDLTVEVRDADLRQRQVLEGQLEQTLGALGSLTIPVSKVEVTVEQQRFDLQPVPSHSGDPLKSRDEPAPDLLPPPDVDARPVVLNAKNQVARLVGRSVVLVPGLESLAVAGAVAPAVDASSQTYAVLAVNQSRLLVAVPGGSAMTVLTGQRLVPPSFDPFGWVWSGQQDSRGVVFAAQQKTGAVAVKAPWLNGSRLASIRISREGARALVVTRRPDGGGRVYVCGVIRDGRGEPVELAPPLPLLPDAQTVSGAAWVDGTHVMVLGRRPGKLEQPWLVEIGGDVQATLPGQGTAVTVGNSQSDLYLQGPAGQVSQRLGSSWVEVPGARWPSMPG